MRNYAGTCTGICSYNLVRNFLIQLLPLQSSVFLVHFSNVFWHGNEAFPKGNSQNEIISLLVIQLIQGCEKMLSLVSLSKSKFFTRFALVLFVQHSCNTRVVRVALTSNLCFSRVIRVTLVWLVPDNDVVKQTRLYNLAYNSNCRKHLPRCKKFQQCIAPSTMVHGKTTDE